MIKAGILNPDILSLLARVRHTNTIVIADRGFPFWPMIETIDISVVDDLPTVLQVLRAAVPACNFGAAFMAEEFLQENDDAVLTAYKEVLGDIPLTFEHHEAIFKKRVPHAIGLIRTGDTTQYGNIILESA
ncbi:MAG: transport protein RbsD/FucU [Lentisphaerae bacterium]|jgi:D-ribose pyranase|nr:transport protein RbsD/FucU [Lentisphaerota bacterium]MBT4817013.1 transport protein RbsD/FucU [Lentisphaerota bacterium]MBT5604715.1 transport protein RbsD/FucU [Lentisphaerota bacterium]MBT7058111.1 transport protein RbsD/FucU [Lentisphaerota bacterium]MBT7841799.1 transport protein RbsD/FucU [Lentisphaerota bacterium]